MKKYQPQSLAQLKAFVKDESVYLGDIDTSNIADMSSLFEPDVCGAWARREDFSGIESWNVSNAYNMSLVFHNCHFFNADISGWNASLARAFIKCLEIAIYLISLWANGIQAKCVMCAICLVCVRPLKGI